MTVTAADVAASSLDRNIVRALADAVRTSAATLDERERELAEATARRDSEQAAVEAAQTAFNAAELAYNEAVAASTNATQEEFGS